MKFDQKNQGINGRAKLLLDYQFHPFFPSLIVFNFHKTSFLHQHIQTRGH
jgi:hypothetical protein